MNTLDAPYLNCHSLSTQSNVLLVRDALGRPKQCWYGDANRVTLSPQTQRRAHRMHMRDQANLGAGPLASRAWGLRTREWALSTAESLHHTHRWDHQEALDTARAALNGLGLNFGATTNTAYLTKVMVFAPENAGETLAKVIHTHQDELATWIAKAAAAKAAGADTKTKKSKTKGKAATGDDDAAPAAAGKDDKTPPMPQKVRNQLIAALAPADAIDIALYGRFLTEIATGGNVDGAIQTTTAFSVEPANIVEDYFSAADDRKIARQRQGADFTNALALLNAIDPLATEDPEQDLPLADNRGAGMTGYQPFVSGTFYAHSVLDRALLRRNLRNGGTPEDEIEDYARAAEQAFLDAFVNAVPGAKKNTTAAPGTLPKLVLVHEGKRPYNYATCFEEAIQPSAGAPSIQGATRLLQHHAMITRKQKLDPGTVLTYDLAVSELFDDLRLSGQLGPLEVHTPEELATPLTAGQPT
ncbi:type I-E CRISPR-associated protein Cas7/Cse4/CasC [Streptomyces sp. NPDC001717]|uniref:type I-E CRISPR-associated protein Cas7/Cse4/CasC n=1 Tax=Streptomyces sp. NPDC001717 TaxID=3364604 RepID=UPI00369CFE2A